VWDDGHAGYRAEEVVAVTDDGYRMLSDHHYWPYD
jgi:Xaa-Pro dipeptidase